MKMPTDTAKGVSVSKKKPAKDKPNDDQRFELILPKDKGREFREAAKAAGHVQGPQDRENCSAFLRQLADKAIEDFKNGKSNRKSRQGSQRQGALV